MLNQCYKYKWVVLPIIQISDGVVTFSLKDYPHGGTKKNNEADRTGIYKKVQWLKRIVRLSRDYLKLD